MKQLAFIFILMLIGCDSQRSRYEIKQYDITESQEKIAYLTSLQKEDPRNAEIFYKKAEVYALDHRYREATIEIQKAISLDDTNAEFHLLAGKIYAGKVEPAKALEALLQAEVLGLRTYDLYKEMAQQYMQTNQPDQAKKSVDRLTTINSSASNWNLKGKIYLALNDTTEAIASFKKAIVLNRTLSEPYESLATIQMMRKDYEQALAFVDSAISLKENNADLLMKKAGILMTLKQADAAKAVYKNLLADRVNNDLVYLQLSNIYYAQAKYDSTIYYAELADSTSVESQMMKARGLDALRRYQDAILVYQYIIEMDSTNNIAQSELEILQRKVAYLWRLRQQQQQQDSAASNMPKMINKKEIDN